MFLMVDPQLSVDLIFQALAHPTRRRVLYLMAQHNVCTPSELAKLFKISRPSVSSHLTFLEKSGLVRRTIRGRTHYFSLNPQALSKANQVTGRLQSQWEQRAASLEDFMNQAGDLTDGY